MRIEIPDPDYTASRRAGANFILAIKLTIGFVAMMWAVFLFDQVLNLDLIRFGLRPREGVGLLGLLTTPLLHFNLAHITSNTAPLLVGGTAVLYLYPNSALRVLPLLYLSINAAAWIFARPSVHIGASGLVYGLLAFVFVSGILRRDLRSIVASLLIWFLYGGMLWGVLPAGRSMSWELHASGLIFGVLLAMFYRNWDQPPMKHYSWEDEEDPDEALDPPWRDRDP